MMAQETIARDETRPEEYRAVGKPVTRIDGAGKVTGKTLYADDIKLPRMLHAKVLGSPHAHALIRSMDTAAARAHPGVEAVITHAELPDYKYNASNRRGVIFPQGPATGSGQAEVLFYGQPVAAVLASDPHVAEEALGLIEVEYEVLTPVVDPIAAMTEGSPLVRSPIRDVDRSEERGHVTVDVQQKEQEDKPTNIASQMSFRRGDVEAGFAEADCVVERTWRTAIVHQSYIEPHSTIADYDASGELSVWTSTQAPFYIRDELAQTLGVPENKIRVTATEVGGGFGGKIYLTELLVAALAMAVRRPVKYIMTRKEDMLAATPAPQAIVDLKTGMKRDGTLTAIKARLIYDSGAFPGAPMLPGCLLVGGYYKCANLEIQGYEVLTNKVSVGALRAPGAHNATFAIESHMDMMAKELGLDPLEVRLKNAVEEGDPLPSGQPYPRIGLKQCLEAIAGSEVWKRRVGAGLKPAPTKNRGVGLALGGWMGGLQPASAIVCLNSDGTINVTVGSADITGTNTSFQQITAEVLNLPLPAVNVTSGDTKTAPYAGMSAGSKTTYTVGRAVKEAAEDAKRQMLEVAARRLEAAPEDLEMADGVIRVKGSDDKSLTFERLGRLTTNFAAPYAAIVGRGTITSRKWAPGFTAQAAEVEVDPETGEVTILGFAVAQDAGFAINPLSVAGQMQGGASQGLGIALWEEMLYDAEGQLLNGNLLDYRLPTSRDLPAIEAIIVEVPSEEGPYGARIVGEPSIVAGAAAIGNAVAEAAGARVTEAPITPERVLRALGKL
ncbi:MAG: xanthine dehydrogenase family protein molybdopterin-binding subunit [Dehalococcoidia bacterium]|nr:xanthine dehydrogenase family protein molybdopterin-binding subunit [Dehalococcoidia bacterium]